MSSTTIKDSGVSYPLNMPIGNRLQARTGAKWKMFEVKNDFSSNTETPNGQFTYPKRYTLPGLARPFFNKQNGSSYESSSKNLAYTGTGSPYGNYTVNGDANAFRARPIKHYRLQYGDTNNKQTYFNRKYLIENMNRPGGTSMATSSVYDENASTIIDNINTYGKDICDSSGNCATIVGIPDVTLGILEKVGKYNPIYFDSNNKSNNYNSDNYYEYPEYKNKSCIQCPTYQCSNICDPEIKAKKRVRYSSRLNRPELCERPYHVNNSSYLRARCKTFSQNSFQFKSTSDIDDSVTIPSCECNEDPNCTKCCGLSAYESKAFRGNCPEVSTCDDSITNGVYSTDCSTVYYKPNNCQFAQQGAVSSSSRILRLKLNTINSNANSIRNSYGSNAANALSYSGRPQAPFINKQKMNAGGYANKCDTNLYHLYRPGGGNPTTSCMNNSNNNRIIGHRSTTSEYPTRTNFKFMSRQSNHIKLTGTGNRTLDGNKS